MMRAIIVDDEIDALENLQSILTLFNFDVQVIGTANSADVAVKMIDALKPDLLFLDIEMPNGNGFELLERVNYKKFQIIFVTAFSQYAIKALRMNALDYLLKPIDPDDLGKAIKQALKSNSGKSYPVIDPLIDGHKQGAFTKLGLPTSKGVKFVETKNIIRFQASSNYTTVFTKGEKPTLISKTLKTFEKTLEGREFIRVHQSHLINLSFVEEYNRGDGSYLVLNNGDKIPVSKSRKAFVNRSFQRL